MASTIWNSSLDLPLLHFLRQRRALRGFIAVRAIDELNSQMLNVAIAWYVYATTHSPMSLAYVGLARFLPNLGMALITGQAADRLDRRWIIGLALLLQALCAAAFGILSFYTAPLLAPVYLLLLLVGTAHAFSSPAMSATLPNLVNAEEFPRAVAVASSVHQICSLIGPAVGGLLYAFSGPGMFAGCAALYLVAITQLRRLADTRPQTHTRENRPADASPLAGIRYVRSNRFLLGAISLDLFAVLLGGVTALLPIYAKDILAVGPAGLGCLRCAPGVGAAIVGLLLAHRTIQRRAGKLMLLCVAGFGLATVVFALSTNLWLSLAARSQSAASTWSAWSLAKRSCRSPRQTPCAAASAPFNLCSSVRPANSANSNRAPLPRSSARCRPPCSADWARSPWSRFGPNSSLSCIAPMGSFRLNRCQRD